MISNEQRMKNLSVPTGKFDVVLDTDACNEIDDQFAISYLLRSGEKCNVRALYAAPYFNKRSESPADGMEKSYHELFRLLELLGESKPVFRGSTCYLPDEKTPVISDAARASACIFSRKSFVRGCDRRDHKRCVGSSFGAENGGEHRGGMAWRTRLALSRYQ